MSKISSIQKFFFLSLIIAGAMCAPVSAQGVKTNTHVNNSVLYVADLEEITNGLYLKYVYTPNIIPDSSLIAQLKTVFVQPFDLLIGTWMPSTAAASIFSYTSNLPQGQITSPDWSNFLATINTVFSGQFWTISILDYTTGNFVNPAGNGPIYQVDYVPYINTRSYDFLTKTEETLTYDYIGGVLTPIIEQTLYYDHVDIREATLLKELLTTTINDDVGSRHAMTLQAWVENGVLHVSGLTAGETWNVYNAAGGCIYTNIAGADLQSVPMQTHGVYIVKQGNNAVKVVY